MPYTLLYTVQHKECIDEIIKLYRITSPLITMYNGLESNKPTSFIRWFLNILFKSIFRCKYYLPKRGIVLTHGDTFTTWLAALMGRLAKCDVAHIESGLRSYNLLSPFPEELSRILTFLLSNIYFCSDTWAISNLQKFTGEKVNIGCNTMLDGVRFAVNREIASLDRFEGVRYVVVSIHRYENIFTDKFVQQIIPYIKLISNKYLVIFVLHPTTRERLRSLGLFDDLRADSRILMQPRLDFVDWVNLCNRAEFVVTDGGSNQEELSYLGIPTLLLREETERLEGLGENVVLSKLNREIIELFIENYNEYRTKAVIKEVYPSKTIVDYLINRELL